MAKEELPETGDPSFDRALKVIALHRSQQETQVSTGAGLAIAGAWVSGSAVTITMLLIIFVLKPLSAADQAKIDTVGIVLILLLIAAPMIAAYSITRVILSKE